jgi:hypothetical protein
LPVTINRFTRYDFRFTDEFPASGFLICFSSLFALTLASFAGKEEFSFLDRTTKKREALKKASPLMSINIIYQPISVIPIAQGYTSGPWLFWNIGVTE